MALQEQDSTYQVVLPFFAGPAMPKLWGPAAVQRNRIIASMRSKFSSIMDHSRLRATRSHRSTGRLQVDWGRRASRGTLTSGAREPRHAGPSSRRPTAATSRRRRSARPSTVRSADTSTGSPCRHSGQQERRTWRYAPNGSDLSPPRAPATSPAGERPTSFSAAYPPSRPLPPARPARLRRTASRTSAPCPGSTSA